MSTILVVDDEQAIRDAIDILLSDESHTIHTAHNGSLALDVLKRERADLIISDIMMPIVDGHELIRKLREHGDMTPVLLMSAASHPSCQLPNVRCLSKPFDVDEFLGAVHDTLSADRRSATRACDPYTHHTIQDQSQ